MSEAHCPRCREPIRVPEPLPAADASGRCPWCRETFTLHELFDELPPMLQIIDVGSETAEIDEDDAEAYLEEDSDQAFVRDEEPRAAAELASPPLNATPRRQKKSSPVKTILQIIGGGLVSIPLALAILFLLKYFGIANPNLGFEPFDGTPFSAQMTATQPRPVTDIDRQPEPEQGGRLLGEDMADFGEFDAAAELEPMLDDATNDDSVSADPFPVVDFPDSEESDLSDEPNRETVEPESPVEMTAPSDAGQSEPLDDAASTEDSEDLLAIPPTQVASPLSDSPDEERGDSPAQASSDVEAVVTAAMEASVALANHSDSATRSGALKDLYLQLAKLGELASPDQPALYAELFAQLRRENQLETMGQFGKPWFSAPSRLYEGIFATGTLVQQGDGYQFQWEDGETVPVGGWDSISVDPATFAGKKVALLAKIDTAAEPRRFLIAYLERLDLGSNNAEQP